jgi:Holliday junction DNA helicase RuvA
MISRVIGKLVARELDRVEVLTSGGIAYEIAILRTAYEKLPPVGKEIELRTHHVVREDGAFLFGFLDEIEKILFGRLLLASGVGPRLALSLLSTLSPPRLVRAIRERDLGALAGVSGVGRRTAERLVVEMANKLDDLPLVLESRPSGSGVEEALRALTVLGYPQADAERAIRSALPGLENTSAQDLIKAALEKLR